MAGVDEATDARAEHNPVVAPVRSCLEVVLVHPSTDMVVGRAAGQTHMHNAGVEIDGWSTDMPVVVGAQDLRHQQGNLNLQIHLGRADDMDPGEGCDLGVEVVEVESECAREEVQEEVVLRLGSAVYVNQEASFHDQVNLLLMTDSH
jgi:hypothetical protein